eukprot:213652-Alexandrium_andersonii.AAC.1
MCAIVVAVFAANGAQLPGLHQDEPAPMDGCAARCMDGCACVSMCSRAGVRACGRLGVWACVCAQ